ncbi:adenosylcobinamide-GDP ribazoletransferase [Desulforamulus ferrireducens]|uniref:Adenosylcobinamide-GDP ribazoletransferase n=2 Tax=Desulforamulus ferrireducens TaxID=1833852 RepID=A0A1S6IZ73_9FIRM|nr:adenosylcobinamide-GDP ribazoletransferase [Desulforamulus ferrireducens]
MLKSFRLALSFLTILPVYKKMASSEELARSVSYYPLVGLLLGLAAAGINVFLQQLGLKLSADVLSLVAMMILTGGLHLDGLMDTADGLLSGKNREGQLEIMKDSRVGAMGVLTLGIVLLLKTAFLSEINLDLKVEALIIMPVAGRWAMVYAITRYPYARPGGGLGNCLKQAGLFQLLVASLTLLVICVGLAGLHGLAIIIVILLAALGIIRTIYKRLGGMTGDTYGATGELIETWSLFVILLGQQIGLL